MLKIKKTFTLVSIIISLICFSLSIWQVKRLEWKKNLISNIEKAYNSDSININVLSGDLRNFKFKNVYLEGTFINEKSMFLGPRVNKDQVGYHLITPFLLKDGRYILTNRGWLKEIIKIREPNKEYLIKGILKESDIKNIFTPKNNMEKNLWFYISTDEMSKFAGLRLVDNIFVDLIGSNPNHKLTIINSSTPKIVNNHLQYAITWAILGLLFLVMNYIYSKRH
ncbi:MAG: SURF1 family protein [Alphaproteobacteria bacterium]|nr:SURF1 family protein [Alphaproteobacteria bacterium]